jgi:hypothetical protein
MKACLSRYHWFDHATQAAWLLICLALPACQSTPETMPAVVAMDPKISVTETPPRPLNTDLVALQLPPEPVKVVTAPSAPPPINLNVDSLNTTLTSQPPIIAPASQTQTISYVPKRSPLSLALEYFLDHRNDDAIAALKQLSTDDQDMALVMLPLLARIDQGETWASLNGPQKLAVLESLRSLNKRLSKSAPLVLQNVALVERQPERYGEIIPRMNFNYYPEDYVFVYAELVNLVEKQSSISSRNDYHVTARFPVPSHLAPGSYQLIISVLDRDSNRTAKQVLPLQVLEKNGKTGASNKRKG